MYQERIRIALDNAQRHIRVVLVEHMLFQLKTPVQVVIELVPSHARISDFDVNGLWIVNSQLRVGLKNEC